jgi:hypothetical protein
MTEFVPRPSQPNLVVSDLERSPSLYRLLGWPVGSRPGCTPWLTADVPGTVRGWTPCGGEMTDAGCRWRPVPDDGDRRPCPRMIMGC